MPAAAFKTALAWPLWRLLAGSWRLETTWDLDSADGPVIFACLHRDFLVAIRYVRPARPCLLVSSSTDGDILVRTLGTGGYDYVRGSTGSGGGRALVELRRRLEAGRCLGLAVDGPKGPFGRVQDGVLHLARLTGAPILPLRVRASRAWVLGTWDRTVVPQPGSRISVTVGPALRCGRDAGPDTLDRLRSRLEGFLLGQQEGEA